MVPMPRQTRISTPSRTRMTVAASAAAIPRSTGLLLDFTKPDGIDERLASGEPLHEIGKQLHHANRDQDPADPDSGGCNRNREIGPRHALVVFDVTQERRKRVIDDDCSEREEAQVTEDIGAKLACAGQAISQ